MRFADGRRERAAAARAGVPQRQGAVLETHQQHTVNWVVEMIVELGATCGPLLAASQDPSSQPANDTNQYATRSPLVLARAHERAEADLLTVNARRKPPLAAGVVEGDCISCQ